MYVAVLLFWGLSICQDGRSSPFIVKYKKKEGENTQGHVNNANDLTVSKKNKRHMVVVA